MFYWLTELSDKISFFNVFRYITFRTGGAIVTALVFVFLFAGPSEDDLRDALDRNLCRCGTHVRILRAVARYAREVQA